eukprot:3943432-Pleurochrysis_carterae.AAC.1
MQSWCEHGAKQITQVRQGRHRLCRSSIAQLQLACVRGSAAYRVPDCECTATLALHLRLLCGRRLRAHAAELRAEAELNVAGDAVGVDVQQLLQGHFERALPAQLGLEDWQRHALVIAPAERRVLRHLLRHVTRLLVLDLAALLGGSRVAALGARRRGKIRITRQCCLVGAGGLILAFVQEPSRKQLGKDISHVILVQLCFDHLEQPCTRPSSTHGNALFIKAVSFAKVRKLKYAASSDTLTACESKKQTSGRSRLQAIELMKESLLIG